MTSQGWLQIGLTLLIGFLISIPVGRFRHSGDGAQDRVRSPVRSGRQFHYVLIGRRICAQRWTGEAYTLHMLATNLVMAFLIIFLILVFQYRLPLNPLPFFPVWNRCSP